MPSGAKSWSDPSPFAVASRPPGLQKPPAPRFDQETLSTDILYCGVKNETVDALMHLLQSRGDRVKSRVGNFVALDMLRDDRLTRSYHNGDFLQEFLRCDRKRLIGSRSRSDVSRDSLDFIEFCDELVSCLLLVFILADAHCLPCQFCATFTISLISEKASCGVCGHCRRGSGDHV